MSVLVPSGLALEDVSCRHPPHSLTHTHTPLHFPASLCVSPVGDADGRLLWWEEGRRGSIPSPSLLGGNLQSSHLPWALASCRQVHRGLDSADDSSTSAWGPHSSLPPLSRGCQQFPAEVNFWAVSSPLTWFLLSSLSFIAIFLYSVFSVLNT